MISILDDIVEHHRQLSAWLSSGSTPDLEAFLKSHSTTFTLVDKSGKLTAREDLHAALRRVGGTQPGYDIEISDVHEIWNSVYRFTETHSVDGVEVSRRLTTAVITDGRWITVHETSVQTSSGDRFHTD